LNGSKELQKAKGPAFKQALDLFSEIFFEYQTSAMLEG
jgi:hypothetical protein